MLVAAERQSDTAPEKQGTAVIYHLPAITRPIPRAKLLAITKDHAIPMIDTTITSRIEKIARNLRSSL
jgi:hypothetical protein